jgi:hypothetical protein
MVCYRPDRNASELPVSLSAPTAVLDLNSKVFIGMLKVFKHAMKFGSCLDPVWHSIFPCKITQAAWIPNHSSLCCAFVSVSLVFHHIYRTANCISLLFFKLLGPKNLIQTVFLLCYFMGHCLHADLLFKAS